MTGASTGIFPAAFRPGFEPRRLTRIVADAPRQTAYDGAGTRRDRFGGTRQVPRGEGNRARLVFVAGFLGIVG